MKIDYEIDMRWAIASKIWTQLKGQTCLESTNIVKESECNKRFDWGMYKQASFECKGGTKGFKIKDASDVCKLEVAATVDPLIKEMGTFLAGDPKVSDALKEFEWQLSDLKKVFTGKFYVEVNKNFAEFVKVDNITQPIYDDQAICIIAHFLLMKWDSYKEFIKIPFWAWAIAIHYLRVKKYQMYAGISCFACLFLIALVAGGGGSELRQTIIIQGRDLG